MAETGRPDNAQEESELAALLTDTLIDALEAFSRKVTIPDLPYAEALECFLKSYYTFRMQLYIGIRNPGVYLLARLTDSPLPVVDVLDPNILYVGQTCDQTLEKRLYQFSRSAFHRKKNHSGGWKFCDLFNEGRPAEAPAWLFVSLLPVIFDEPKRPAWIQLVERQILWDFVCEWDRLPLCNSK